MTFFCKGNLLAKVLNNQSYNAFKKTKQNAIPFQNRKNFSILSQSPFKIFRKISLILKN